MSDNNINTTKETATRPAPDLEAGAEESLLDQLCNDLDVPPKNPRCSAAERQNWKTTASVRCVISKNIVAMPTCR